MRKELSTGCEIILSVQVKNRPLPILIACFACLTIIARAQERPQKKVVFSGVVTEAECQQMPSQAFTIPPSMDRAETNDLLTVRCLPMVAGPFGVLSLTFTIDVNGKSTFGMRGKLFYFRWGKAVDAAPSFPFAGQFTYNPSLCARLAKLFSSDILKPETSDPDRIPDFPKLSAECHDDDRWGTSMELTLTGDLTKLP
ncbi:MAG: hypothetical protein WBW84_03030 [Acidobacteriaceae bacterium]